MEELNLLPNVFTIFNFEHCVFVYTRYRHEFSNNTVYNLEKFKNKKKLAARIKELKNNGFIEKMAQNL
jgi:hypothetical protein